MVVRKKTKKVKLQTDLIVPSTKLYTVNSHKLADTSCNRYYFWRWVLNLVPKSFNINFWFGSMIHKGIEEIGAGKKLVKAKKAMVLEDKKFCKNSAPGVDVGQEVRIQRDISQLLIAGYYRVVKEKMKGLTFGGAEMHFKKKLKQSDVVYEGTLDAWYKSKRRLILVEGKTAKNPNNEYFRRLKFDLQINGYADALHDLEGRYPRECYYTVFRKPQIRQRKNETPSEFYVRLKQDLIDRQDWYYIFYKHLFGKGAIKAVMQDIEWTTFDLAAKYDYLTTEQLLQPENWPRSGSQLQCFTYGTCPYFALCQRPKSYPLYYRFFKMRDIRYDLEWEELNPKRTINTKSRTKMKGTLR